MSDSTAPGDVVEESAARTPESVIEGDATGERHEAFGNAHPEVVQRAGAVALQGEDVLAGLEDRLGPLADRGEAKAVGWLVLVGRPEERRSLPRFSVRGRIHACKDASGSFVTHRCGLRT